MKQIGLLALPALMLAGCQQPVRAPDYVMVAPRPPPSYERLGHAEGVACGSSWFMFMLDRSEVADVGYNHRLRRAYANALDSVPGATGLINIELRRNSTYYLIGATSCITVLGEAIR